MSRFRLTGVSSAGGVVQRDGSNRGYAGRNELPLSHCPLRFLVSLTIVYCRINKLCTDNSSGTLT